MVVGVERRIAKPSSDDEGNVTTTHAHTMPEAEYNENAMDKLIKSKRSISAKRLQTRIEHQEGSGWSLSSVVGLCKPSHTQKPSGGFPYIPTAPALCNSKLGLANIKNEDQEFLKYRMLYHQIGEKVKHNDRVTVLKKVEDKWKWEGVNYPASFDDITKF